jgi:hypothetical protein
MAKVLINYEIFFDKTENYFEIDVMFSSTSKTALEKATKEFSKTLFAPVYRIKWEEWGKENKYYYKKYTSQKQKQKYNMN